ncbi:hypothetical protein E4U55_006282 [Claviceps digitariae]|nr:hypothetical protein E4U55_006282 [Claviceps digitariae]
MAYALVTSYAGEALLSGFNWIDSVDLNHGFVSYQSRPDAQAKGLYSVDANTGVVRLGVDSTNVMSVGGSGRPSIRLESKESYSHGLFIADFLHMPPSQCGLWPAFWAYGRNWPFDGEIDIIEGASDQHSNLMSAHTSRGCTLSKTIQAKASGTTRSNVCDVDAQNVGCGYDVPASDTSSYGDAFNAAGGGVYAMEWDSDHIKIWHFGRSQIPRDIKSKKPNPDEWGLPHAIFGGDSCDLGTHFKTMNLVINTNFCGDWAGNIWGRADGCGTFAPTCSEFVAKNPQAFRETHWDVHYIDVYQTKAKRSPPAAGVMSRINPKPTNSTILINDRNTTTVINYKAKLVSPAADSPSGASSSLNNLPGAPSGPKDPLQVGGAALLGCFGSSNGFRSFLKVADKGYMTVERCVEFCNGSMYVGIYDTQCFCADTLDANTRAVNGDSDDACNHPCPGNRTQVCGGMTRNPAPLANFTEIAAGTVNKASKFVDATGADTAAAVFLPTNTTAPLTNITVTDQNSMKQRDFHLKRKLSRRDDEKSRNILLTVYGTIEPETTQPLPPLMAQGQNTNHLVASPPAHALKFAEDCDCDTDSLSTAPPSVQNELEATKPPVKVASQPVEPPSPNVPLQPGTGNETRYPHGVPDFRAVAAGADRTDRSVVWGLLVLLMLRYLL